LESLVITGGNPIQGKISVEGAKNSVLPILAASLLSKDKEGIWLDQIPRLQDVDVMIHILKDLGVQVKMQGRNLFLDTRSLEKDVVEDYHNNRMRSSIFLMGPLLGRMGKVTIGYPGGCRIGERPIDLHLKGLSKMGIKINMKGHRIEATGFPKGALIHLDAPSVGATENLMMAGVLAKGETVISNAAKEPEIVDLQNFIIKMGGRITGAGTDTIKIKGVDALSGGTYQVIPDRIVAGTYLLAAAATKGELLLENIIPRHLEALCAKLGEAGAELEKGDDYIWLRGKELKSLEIRTLPYPGFPTDLQPPMTSLLTQAQGASMVKENVFEGRFDYLEELNKMGANVTKIENRKAIIKGKTPLTGAKVNATDLRAGAALVIAGLVAKGHTTISNIFHLDRGYERIEEKFRNLNACIERRKDDNENAFQQSS